MEPRDGFTGPNSRQRGYFQAQQSSLQEQLSGRYVANHFYRVLGPQAQTDTWQAVVDLFWQVFSSSYPRPGRIRKKASVTDHLPKGFAAQRRGPRPG